MSESCRFWGRGDWMIITGFMNLLAPLNVSLALDFAHMERPGEDEHFFRAIAERSMLVDIAKESGAVAISPPLAEEWWDRGSAL